MIKRLVLAISVVLFAGAAALPAVAVDAPPASAAATLDALTPAVMRVNVPGGYDPNSMYVLVGRYGKGLALSPARREPLATEFTGHIGVGYTSAKILIYYPGCKLVTAEFKREDMSLPFTPVFEKLKMLPLRIRLTRSDGTPMAGQPITLIQSIPDMPYFGYADGMDFSMYTAPAASGTTDDSGVLAVKVPALLDDPLYAALKVKPSFEVHLGSGPARDWLDRSKGEPVPGWIAARGSYPEPIAIQWVQHGTISGKVEQSFLKANGIDVPMGRSTQPGGYSDYSVWFEADHKGGGTGVGVQADGSFSMSLSPGTYDLSIQVRRGPGSEWKTFTVRHGFVIGEKEKKEITIK